MIDLSFLTEEEQEAIMKVLQRDAALKKAEEERVRHLPEKIKDDQQLKNMSGQWFYEAKAKRHRDKIHGADIIRASMRKKRLQVAAEQSKDRAIGAKESWVNNVNKDAFLSSEVAGVVEEPKEDTAPASPSSRVMSPASTAIDVYQENTRESTISPAKQRKNPFNNSKLPEDHLSQQTKNEQSKNGRAGLFQISKEGELFESKEKPFTQDISSQMLEKPKHPMPEGPVSGPQGKAPIPKARKLIYKSNGSKQDDNQPFPRQRTDSLNAKAVPRGILKRNSSSSSTDSETLRLNHTFEPRTKIVSPGLTIHERISEKDLSLEDDSSSCSLEPLKHVRFSAVKDELPQSSGLIHGREVGEFSVLESDKLKNGTGEIEDTYGFLEDLKSSHRKLLPFHESRSSPSVTKNETQPPVLPSGSSPNNGLHSYSEVLTPKAQSIEESPTSSEHQELTRLESKFSKSPADELSHCVKPEPSQVLDHSSRDHQQGKLPLLEAKTSLCSGSQVSEIRKTTDDSISKVLDWFNRSSHSDDSNSSLQHSQGRETKEKADSPLKDIAALEMENVSLKENDSKSLSPTKVTLKPVKPDLTFQGEGDMLFSENCKDNNMNNKSECMNLSQQGTSGKDLSIPFESYQTSSQGSKTMDISQNSISTGKGNGSPAAPSNYSCSILQGSDSQVQALCNSKNIGSLGKGEPKLPVQEKNRENTEVNLHSWTSAHKPNLKDDVEAEIKNKKGNSSILQTSLETENRHMSPGAAHGGSPWQDVREVPKKQTQREKYVRVSERISFWEREKAGANLTHKESIPSSGQKQPCAETYQPLKSQGMATDMNEYCQVTAKRVVLDDDDQVPHISTVCSSNQLEEPRPQIPDPSKDSPSAGLSEKLSVFQKKSVKQLPVEDSWCSAGDRTLPALPSTSNTERERQTPLEKNRLPIGESNANFKVMSLKERTAESNTEQVHHHSQFDNLRKFWDLGANSKDNFENTTNLTKPTLLDDQKHKEFNDTKSSGKNVHEVEALLNHKNLMARQEMKKLNSKCTLQVLPDETTLRLKPVGMSTHQLAGNEPSKENVEKNSEWLLTPVIKKETDYSTQEIEESIVKMGILSIDDKVTFNDSLASLPPIQPFDGQVHGKYELKPGISETRTWSQKAHYSLIEEDPKGPREITAKELIEERVDKTVAPPKFKQDILAACLDKLLKEATGASYSTLQSTLEPITTRTNSQPEEGRFCEEGTKQDPNGSAYLREVIAPFPEEDATLGDVAFTQKADSGECELHREGLLQMAEKGPPLLEQASPPCRKHDFEDETHSPKDVSFTWDAHLAPQDRALPSQREISETIEKVILPSTPVMADVNTTLQRLLKEAGLSYPPGNEAVPGGVKAELPEGNSVAGSFPSPLGVAPPKVTVDRVVRNSSQIVPDKACEYRSYLATQISPSEQLVCSSVSTVAQNNIELPQEVAEMVRQTIIEPRSECCLEFSSGLEKLLRETLETSPSTHGKDPEMLSSSEIKGSADRHIAPEIHPEEVQETVEKIEAPTITESAFDIGLEKLLKEVSEAPLYSLELSVEEEAPEKGPSQSEPSRVLGTMPHVYCPASGASKMKGKMNDLESQVKECDKLVGGVEAVADLLVDHCGSASDIETPGTSQLEDYEIGATKMMRPPEGGDKESDIAGRQEPFQVPGFEEAFKVISGSRKKQPVPLWTNKENSPKANEVEYKRQDEEQEKGNFSDSDFSDRNTTSNAESWRSTSSSEEEPSPVLKTLEKSASRKMPSKSLEDISSDSSKQAKVDILPEDLVHSAEDVSTVPSQPDNQFSYPDKLKRMSKSVPAFLQDESDDRETDTASESSYQLSRHKKSPGSLTNLSSSSGMTSLSSVSGSVMSIYSGDFGNLEVKGHVQFAVDYVESLKELHVFVAQCKDLAAADVKKQRSDPYVKTYLLPDKGKMGKRKTLVMKKTLNPVYNEILRYKIEKQILKTQKLNLSVWHRDTFKRNSFLGEVELDLEAWDWDNKQNTQLRWYPLKRKTAPVALEAENRGEMKLALQYVPEPTPGKKLHSTGEVHIWVKECLELPLLRGSHLNSFVRCTILPDTSRKSRQKTRAVGKTTNPVFNHTMVYDGFRPEDLKEACVELTVWDHYKLTNQFLGGLRIGFGTGKSYGTEVDWMDSTSEEVALWEKMVNSPNSWIEATLPLRMLLIAKISK
ncbi:PREDICTED: synaptotagmin-like protein 2 isoform X1 [Dipodomys ordii]|uniref:Synaptotagmin-like protein 2 n=3 Tax=Dipodomys ordii TaxID=10020 RepID=A0A1S3EYU5_DIPOR|nr:PREDICTED: synaptotagmin-like protein 2 isoform X1 [Dipodomys ordii]